MKILTAILSILVLSLGIVSYISQVPFAIGAPTFVIERSIQPEANNLYWFGTSSPAWSDIFTYNLTASSTITFLGLGSSSDCLITNSSGVLSTTGCGGSVAGSDTQIQFNNGGSFGGDSNFTWATSSQLLTVTGSTTITGVLNLTNALTVGNGGIGVNSLTDGGVLLGSNTSAITAMSVLSDSEFIVGDGSGDPVAESGGTLRTSIGVGTGDTPLFSGLTLSNDLTVVNGGTGASSFTDGGLLLGSGTSSITALGVASNGQIPIGDNSTDPVLATITGDDGITITNGAGSIEIDVTPVASGSDGDSTTTQSDSGLEIVSNELTILRGCDDNEILKWDETDDDWNCEADVSAGGTSYDTFLFALNPGGAVLPNSNFAALTKKVGTNYVGLVLNFDNTTAETAFWTYQLPTFTALNTCEFVFSSLSGSTGTSVLQLTYRAVANDEVWDATTGEVVATTSIAHDTADDIFIKTDLSISTSAINSGELMLFEARRNVAESVDTLAADVSYMGGTFSCSFR